ncbi:hypothetical protein Pan44_13260 [Caulifigura coniformis]|uniref:Uncharacterized protein n=1 Tax=Caulifigura coniformis TaxID=2527983 RepID=A0A517SAZ2_9PLAN|nr:hypothetical protein [Caulifigura coniformis]QDT53310.1 hypothetical protein Pan44_13260 [Caulifigura coniformis]
METNSRKTEFDSAIIRVEMLKRFQLTAQAKAGDDEGRSLEVDGKCVRLAPQQRELSTAPFGKDRI